MRAPRPLDVSETLAEQLDAATVAHRDAQEVAQVCAKRWKELIVEAVDSGVRIRDVAAKAGISAARVHAIVADVYSKSS